MSLERTTINEAEFAADWNAHMPVPKLAAKYGLSKEQVYYRRQVLNLKPRRHHEFKLPPRD